jgi:betaine lipid synthase
MAVLDFLPFAKDPFSKVVVAGSIVLFFLTAIFLFAFVEAPKSARLPETAIAYAKFFYACFLKPHSGGKGQSQQDALESFYKAQAAAYDATRKRLLHGRENMLGMVAAQLQQKEYPNKPIWVDVRKYCELLTMFITKITFRLVEVLVGTSSRWASIYR